MKKKGSNLVEKKLLFEDFVQENRFELNLYLTYLLKQGKYQKNFNI